MLGDKDDMQVRLRSLLPSWFPDASASPVLSGLLAGISNGFAQAWTILQYVRKQTRIATADGGWLDLIAWDYFGSRFLRRASEGDEVWRPRILQEILRPRQTRDAITQMLTDLTGHAPLILEPSSAYTEGCYGVGTMAYGFGLGYGSLQFPNQMFITAYRPTGQGIVNIAGYGSNQAGYGVSGLFSYVDMSLLTGPVLDSEIYLRIAQTIAAGTVAWTSIQSGMSPVVNYPKFDFTVPANRFLTPWLGL